jgi:hypothetical protein
MLAELQELWRIVVELLNEPVIRVGTTILAVTSAILGIWATQKARSVLHAHEQQILVQQLQLLDDHWQRFGYAILTDDKIAAVFAKMAGVDDLALVRTRLFIEILIDILSSAYSARSRNILPDDLYETQFRSVAAYFLNRAELFFSSIDKSFYSKNFIDDCERRFKQLNPLKGTEAPERWGKYEKILSELTARSP